MSVGTHVRFAHPVEHAFACVLDATGVPWLYEPHTFVLARHVDGAVAQAFTPDFYLPDQDLYLECTVARPHLLRRKRRKVEAAQHLYGITVHLLARADLERVALRWSLDGLERALEPRVPTIA